MQSQFGALVLQTISVLFGAGFGAISGLFSGLFELFGAGSLTWFGGARLVLGLPVWELVLEFWGSPRPGLVLELFQIISGWVLETVSGGSFGAGLIVFLGCFWALPNHFWGFCWSPKPWFSLLEPFWALTNHSLFFWGCVGIQTTRGCLFHAVRYLAAFGRGRVLETAQKGLHLHEYNGQTNLHVRL